MDNLKVIIETFEKFIKRSLLPSSSFLLFLILYDIFINEEKILTFLEKVDSSILIVVIFMLFMGLSVVLTILHQTIYDNFLKGNFDGILDLHTEDKYLEELRKEVQNTLNSPESTDYILYQQIKSNLKNIGKEIDTDRYVDDAKTIGITLISIMIILIYTIWTNRDFTLFVICLSFIVIIYLLGRELIKAKYRSRAIHLYTLYLHEKKNKYK